MTFIPEGREQDLAAWSSVLAVDMTADALMEAYSEALQAWEDLPWWRVRARRRALWRAELYLAVYWAVAMKAQQQDRARNSLSAEEEYGRHYRQQGGGVEPT